MRVLLLALVMFSGGVHAGYQAETVTGNSGNGCYAGRVSPCMATAGMAITNVCAYITAVTALDVTAGTFSASPYSGVTGTLSGKLYVCSATPSFGNQAVFANGLTDPAIVEGGLASGGTGSTSGGALTIDGLGFEQEAFELAFQAGLLMFVTGLGIGLLVQIIRRMRTP